jgi:pilus assembly protein CpaB
VPDTPDVASTLYKAAAPKARRSGLRLLVFVAISLVAAIGSALLLTRYMEARTAEARLPTRPVVIAAVDLPVGAELRPENLAVVAWPAASVPAGAFEDPKELEGKAVASRIYRAEPLLAAKLVGGNGLSALLPAGMRAVAVRVDDVVGVAGFVQPGDSVDVIVTIRADGGMVISSKVILQAVRVLAVGKELDTRAKGDKVVPATVATLMVDAAQSEWLALAAAQGKILLTLRSATDTDVVATKGITPSGLLARGEGAAPTPAPLPPPRRAIRAQRPAPAPPPSVAVVEKPKGDVVEILRGDVYEKRNFAGRTP